MAFMQQNLRPWDEGANRCVHRRKQWSQEQSTYKIAFSTTAFTLFAHHFSKQRMFAEVYAQIREEKKKSEDIRV